MRPSGPFAVATMLLLGACGAAVDRASQEERLRAEAERAAGLEAAEKEILNAGLPMPAEPVAAGSTADGANAATADSESNRAF